MPGFITVIQADIDGVRIVLGKIDNHYPRALHTRHVARRRSISPGSRLGLRLYGIYVEILIAVIIFNVKNVLAVTAPEITCHRALGLGR